MAAGLSAGFAERCTTGETVQSDISGLRFGVRTTGNDLAGQSLNHAE